MITFLNCHESSDKVATPAEPAIPIPIEEPIRPPIKARAPPIVARDAGSNNIFQPPYYYLVVRGIATRFFNLNGLYSLPPPS